MNQGNIPLENGLLRFDINEKNEIFEQYPESETLFKSVGLCWYSFPFPKITQTQKAKIEELVHLILDERDKNFPKTMAELYDPNKMPEGLKQAHHNLDMYIEKCYTDKPFQNDEERLEYLFKLYEKMIKEENK